MFVLTQFIGLYVVNYYSQEGRQLPYGMETPEPAEIHCEINSILDFFKCTEYLYSLVIAFIIAIFLLFFLTKFKAELILKIWFFIVIIIALGIAFNSIIPSFPYSSAAILIITTILAFFKIFKRSFLLHNLTELFVYPGIASVFVPILNLWTIIILLILISIYDMWAVWHSGIMQKMAKFQINKLKIFAGFFVPYMDKKMRVKFQQLKLKKGKSQNQRIKVNVAILGGGDVIFPIITAGVMLKTFGLIPALLVILGATIGVSYLFIFAEKKKFYPAMPFITAGIFAGMVLSWLL